MPEDDGRAGNEFGVGEILRETMVVFRGNWLRYLKWGAVPLLLGIAGLALFYSGKSGWTAAGGAVLAATLLLIVAFNIRVYRHLLLGEQPQRFLVRQVFTSRVVMFIVNAFVMNIYRLIVSIPAAVACLGLWYVIDTSLDPYAKLAVFRFFDTDTVREWVAFYGFLFLAERILLIYPDVAVDGEASFSNLKKKAGRARKRIILAVVALWAGPYLLGYALKVAEALDWNVHPRIVMAGWVLDLAAYVAASVLTTVLGGVVYSRLVMPRPAAAPEPLPAQGEG